jgi:hypothetical protein
VFVKPPYIFIGVLFILVLAIAGYYFFGWGKPAAGTAEVVIGNSHFKVEIADTPTSRAQGLSGRPSLAEDSGMLFLFDDTANHGFWMKDMNFAIDIIWIKGDKIVGFRENAEPEPGKSVSGLEIYYPPEPVDKVLEINAGLAGKYNFHVGDAIKIEIR